jgi:hypothetical protein
MLFEYISSLLTMKKPAPSTLTLISWIIKIAIVIAAAFYIYQKIAGNRSLNQFPELISRAWSSHPEFFAGAFFLMFLNWALESWKWMRLLDKLSPIGYWGAFRSVIAGVTTGIFTPNRAGEFGGRVFCLEEGHRIEAALLSAAGGLTQLLITVLAALPVLLFQHHLQLPLDKPMILTGLLVFILLLVLVLYGFRAKGFSAFQTYMRVFRLYRWTHWLGIGIISGARYLVFSLQFYLLLAAFDVHLNFIQAYIGIAMTFFCTTVIPTLAVSEIGVRGSVSLLFVGMYSGNSIGILSASLLLWIINIALPALAGSIFVLRIRLFSKNNA